MNHLGAVDDTFDDRTPKFKKEWPEEVNKKVQKLRSHYRR